MDQLVIAVALAASAAIAPVVDAQPLTRAQNNEVFYTDKEGKQRVMLPPMPRDGNGKPATPTPDPYPLGDTRGSLVYMIETGQGLIECSELHRRLCRASTFGKRQQVRYWIVRRNGLWHMCNGPEATATCVVPIALEPKHRQLTLKDLSRSSVPPRAH